MPNVKGKSISLVLGSGGARGLAHIGVIHYLHENDYTIKSISGCSMGALIGGIYAAGKLDEFEHWVSSISKVDIVNLLDISWKSTGLVKGDKIINTLKNLVGDVAIESLAIKYTAVAADIVNEKEVWMNSGSLFDAIRASISLPLFFTPFNYQGIELIDGGVLNPVPIAPTFSDNTDFTIAVNLGGDVVPKAITPNAITQNKQKKVAPDVPTQAPSTQDPLIEFSTKINQFINRLVGDNETQKTPLKPASWGAYDIANQAFDAMQSTISRQKLAAYPADYTIEIARNACGTLEFDRAKEMIALGYQQAEAALSTITHSP